LAEKREPRKTACLKVTGDSYKAGTPGMLDLTGLSVISRDQASQA
jgi:hypothetical protein